jgi:hypothetical protein
MTNSTNRSWNTTRRVWVFVLCQTLVLTAGVTWAAYRVAEQQAARVWPAFRNEPLRITPLYNVPQVCSDEQLERLMPRLALKLVGAQTQINHIDHAQRCWGVHVSFNSPNLASGQDLREILLDNNRFVALYGPKTPPFLMDGPWGVRFRNQDGLASASHHDHTLAGQAEVGTPLDYPVITPLSTTNVRELLETSLRDFSLNQIEYEWSSLAYALYMPTPDTWYTTEGQEVSFDRLAERIMREDVREGVCAANHRMFGLVAFLRIDDQTPLLSPEMRARVIAYLQGVTQTLAASQSTDGSWSKNWVGAKGSQIKDSDLEPLPAAILATGHPLEWWALAPDELLPPRHVLVGAGQWIVKTLDSLTDEQIQQMYTFISHAGRALALWRGRTPADVINNVPPLVQVGHETHAASN